MHFIFKLNEDQHCDRHINHVAMIKYFHIGIVKIDGDALVQAVFKITLDTLCTEFLVIKHYYLMKTNFACQPIFVQRKAGRKKLFSCMVYFVNKVS